MRKISVLDWDGEPTYRHETSLDRLSDSLGEISRLSDEDKREGIEEMLRDHRRTEKDLIYDDFGCLYFLGEEDEKIYIPDYLT